MINENANIKDFFQELLVRGDGLVYVFAAVACLVLLFTNLGAHFHLVKVSSFGKEKWIVVWTFMPVILFFVHIRLRQLIETENGFMICLHGLVQFGIVFVLFLKNWGEL